MIANIGEILWWKYPDGGFEVHDNSDGKGPFLAVWKRSEARPTEAQLLVWELEMVASKKRAAIQAEKVRVRDGGILINGVLFDTDEKAQAAYVRYALGVMADPTLTVPNWKASNGVWVTMTAVLYGQLSEAWKLHEAGCFNWQKQQEELVQTALTGKNIAALRAVSETYSL